MEPVEGGEGESEPRNLKEQKQRGSFLSSQCSRKPIRAPRGLLGDIMGSKAGGHNNLTMRFSRTELSEKDARVFSGKRVSLVWTKSKLKLNKLWFHFSHFKIKIKWSFVVLFVSKSHVLKAHIPLASMQGDPRILPSPSPVGGNKGETPGCLWEAGEGQNLSHSGFGGNAVSSERASLNARPVTLAYFNIIFTART